MFLTIKGYFTCCFTRLFQFEKYVTISHSFSKGRINLVQEGLFISQGVSQDVSSHLTRFSHELHIGFTGLLPVVTMAATGRSK